MPCRIGITTNPHERKLAWERIHPDLKNWKILQSSISSKMEAQRLENMFAHEYSCNSHGGGNDPNNPNARWSVYYFEYGN